MTGVQTPAPCIYNAIVLPMELKFTGREYFLFNDKTNYINKFMSYKKNYM
jgi:hypothetical protein